MDAASRLAPLALEELTGLQVMPYAKLFLDYTDKVVAGLPEDEAELDWRPTDAKGGYYFSLRERAIYISDMRFIVPAWIDGGDVSDKTFALSYGGPDEPWTFKPTTRAGILARNAEGRANVDSWLGRLTPEILGTSPTLEQEFEQQIAMFREKGEDTTARERRGPRRVIDLLLFLLAGEQRHMAVLQYMLRLRGYAVARTM